MRPYGNPKRIIERDLLQLGQRQPGGYVAYFPQGVGRRAPDGLERVLGGIGIRCFRVIDGDGELIEPEENEGQMLRGSIVQIRPDAPLLTLGVFEAALLD